MVGLDRRRLAKFASTVSSLWGEIFFLLFAQAKATEASSKCLSGRNSGPLSRAFTILTFPKDRRQRFFFKTIPRHSWMQFSLARILFCCCWSWCGGRPQHTKQPLTNCCCLFAGRHESSPIRRRSGSCSSAAGGGGQHNQHINHKLFSRGTHNLFCWERFLQFLAAANSVRT